ncbi:hypothetical protein CASFOL_006489 [Castilleja foliolosa]|uniref:F-box domain-containing protein n=1 Tax=Castilleja foliolosa TaxID=1961234 RepID=A0ABD3E7J3_9LAMI
MKTNTTIKFFFSSSPLNTLLQPTMKPNTTIPNELLSSAQIVASIDDLLTEIFLRLPMKSLCRFKLVSKNWDSIISDPGFSLLRNPNPNPAVGLILSVSKGPYAKVLSFDKSTNPQIRTLLDNFPNPFPCQILSSCNGLLLISSTKGTYNCGYPVRHYLICNPTTSKYFRLPESVGWLDCYRTDLAFDPSRSPHYKVVCTRELLRNKMEYQYQSQYQLEVYSSETGCWRNFGRPLSGHVNFSSGVYWNGAIHWISNYLSRKSLYIKLDDDDDDETLYVMPTPPRTGPSNYYFGESCGHLHYIQGHMDVNVMEFNVLEMSPDYSEWFVKYKIDKVNFPCRNLKICSLVRGKKDEDSFLVFKFPEEFVRYNIADRTSETICKLDESKSDQCFQYIESLCSTYGFTSGLVKF